MNDFKYALYLTQHYVLGEKKGEALKDEARKNTNGSIKSLTRHYSSSLNRALEDSRIHMETGDEREFRIDMAMYPNCHLPSDTFRVRKEDREVHGEPYKFYYAVDIATFTINPGETEGKIDRYLHQIGYSQCGPGWLQMVFANDGRLPSGYQVNARRCGISTELTKLCMIDPNISELSTKYMRTKWVSNNKAFNQLNIEDFKILVDRTCSNFVGGFMMADSGGHYYHPYFAIALELGYNLMLIVNNCGPGGFHSLNTAEARAGYDPATGIIQNGNNNIQSWFSIWYFCKQYPRFQ